MPNVSGPVLSNDMRPDTFLSHDPGQILGNRNDGAADAGADIQNTYCRNCFERENAGFCNVANVNEVAFLTTIFENQRRAIMQEAGSKNRKYAGIGIGESLAWAIDIEKAQGNRGDIISLRRDHAHALLDILAERVNGIERRDLVFGSRHGREGRAVVILQLPCAAPQLVDRPVCRGHDLAAFPHRKALTIDAHG